MEIWLQVLAAASIIGAAVLGAKVAGRSSVAVAKLQVDIEAQKIALEKEKEERAERVRHDAEQHAKIESLQRRLDLLENWKAALVVTLQGHVPWDFLAIALAARIGEPLPPVPPLMPEWKPPE